MKIAILGSGGREHALVNQMSLSKKTTKIYCIPGNAGTCHLAENVNLNLDNFESIYDFILKNKIELVVVGPEKPLVDGIVDFLQEKKIKVFGPNKVLSQFEGSKTFTKNICKKYNIPTAKFNILKNLEESIGYLNQVKFPIVVIVGILLSQFLSDLYFFTIFYVILILLSKLFTNPISVKLILFSFKILNCLTFSSFGIMKAKPPTV